MVSAGHDRDETTGVHLRTRLMRAGYAHARTAAPVLKLFMCHTLTVTRRNVAGIDVPPLRLVF